MNKSESIKELAGALAKAQADMPAAKFDATNPFLKNKYASLGAIIEAARPVLAANGLSVSQLPVNEGETIGVTSILMHNSGEWIESTLTLPVSDEKGKSTAQVAGSVITYLRRYALASMLGIYADEDTDGHQPEQKKPAAPKQEYKAKSLMTLEMAEAEVGSDGIKYGDKDNKTLAAMANSIAKVLEQKDLPPEEREKYQYKYDACATIMQARNK